MKRILCVLIAILMMLSLTVPAFAADDVKSISTRNELIELLILGGKGKLETDIRFTIMDVSNFIRRNEEEINPKAEIDLNGRTLTFEIMECSLSLEDVVWHFKNGTVRTQADFSHKNSVKLSNSILVFDETEAYLSSAFSKDSNITLFLTNEANCFADTGELFSFTYRTSRTSYNQMDKATSLLLNLDGGTINLESFKNATFKDGYVDLNSVVPEKYHTKFVGWSNARAEWTTNFTITFDPGEGTCDTKTITTDDKGTINTLPTVTKEGYCFVGWFEEGSSEKVTVDTVVFKDTALHAKLVAKEEQIKNIEKPMKDLGFGEADVQKVISLFSSNKVAGSVIASEPVWGIVIAALVVGAFAGGTIFGRKNKKD